VRQRGDDLGDVAGDGRTGWVAYLAVTRRSAGRHAFALIKVQLPDDVSSLATAAAAVQRIVATEHGGAARVQGLFEWEGGYLCPRWTSSAGRPGEWEGRDT
jgi:hypothetical protein